MHFAAEGLTSSDSAKKFSALASVYSRVDIDFFLYRYLETIFNYETTIFL